MFKLIRRLQRYIALILASLALCFIVAALPNGQQDRQVIAQVISSDRLVEQGVDLYKRGKYTQAISLWQRSLSQSQAGKNKAVIHSNLAQAYRQIGQTSEAIAQWEQAIQIYRTQTEEASHRLVPALLTEQAQAYSDRGQYRRAIALAQEAIASATKNSDRLVVAAAQGTLGNGYWALGNYKEALTAHETSLQIARELKNSAYITTALNNLGNVSVSQAERYRYQANAARLEGDSQEEERLTNLAQKDRAAAIKAFEQAVETSRTQPIQEVRALLNLNRLLAETRSQDKIDNNRDRILALLATQPDSRDKAYALINLAASDRWQNSQMQAKLLDSAIAVARNIGDRRAESFALGSLGQVYESAKQYDAALKLTRQAAFAAQQANAPDSLYRWQWQTGRILKQTNKTESAITAYEQAIATLQTIRGDIAAINQDVQFDFRDAVEPVYRQLIALLLDAPETTSSVKAEAKEDKSKLNNVDQAIEISELLKLAELQNFFGDECVQVALDNARQQERVKDAKAVVIYSVILDNRTEMVVQLPDASFKHHPVETMGAAELQQEIDRLRQLLEQRATDEYLSQAQKIYNALIRPLEADLAATKPSTLVFVNDGVLRKVPMAALHDGKQFLVEKYAIATTPSLGLTTQAPFNRNNLQALILGLTVERPPFAALPNVSVEATGVEKILTGKMLLDRDFTLNNLQTQLQKQNYPIVHMATHGKFGTDATSTFVLTYDSQLTIEQIDNLLRARSGGEPVELLALSACQTAAGDDRAALGIAGVAVRAGVKSALATLWFINDEATVPLIEEFYTQLRRSGVTKAEALRRAQIKMIGDRDYGHPAVWSPFILIGNWL